MKLPRPLAIALSPLSFIYGLATRVRASLYGRGWLKQKRLDAPVISVGNLTMGGTGKTPMVIWLAERFVAQGKRVAILSRGYQGNGESSDEIDLMKARLKEGVLFGVGKNRYAEGVALQSKGVDVYLLDDAFQHLGLARDFDIVLIDATRPLREQFLLPAGTLREPVSAVNRADLAVLTRCNHAPETIRAMQQPPTFPVFPAKTKLIGFRRFGEKAEEHVPISHGLGPLYAFCGIGNPEAFFHDLKEWSVPLVGSVQFRDHHRYTAADVARLVDNAVNAGAKALVTTEKDEQNLRGLRFAQCPVYIAIIELEIPDEAEVLARITNRIFPRRGVAA